MAHQNFQKVNHLNSTRNLATTTTIFLGFVEHVTILIGICVDDDAVAGVIYQPFWENSGRAVWGLVGNGIGGLDVVKPPDSRTFVTTRSHSNKAIEKFIDGLKPCDILRVGGAGNKV